MLRQLFMKIFSLVVIVAMVAGCASATTVAPTTAPAEATTAPEAAAPTTAPASSSCDVNRPIKVALVIAQLGDKSFLDSAARGMQFVNEQFKNVETKIIENNDVGEQQLAARAMADAKYDLVVTVGFGSADWTSQIAAEFPEVKFAIVDAELADADGKALPNGTGLTFREDQGSFTVGMIAGLLTKTGKVGFVGGMDFPLLRRFELGFIQGVKYVNPNVEVTSGWVGSFSDPNKGKELALTQIAEGADIVYAAAGKSGEGVLQAAKEQGKFSIGVDSDQDYLQPGSVVTSMLKRVDLAVLGAVQDLVNCDLKSGTKVFGLEEGSVGATFLYSDDTIFLQEGPDDMVKQLKETVIPAVKTAVEQIKSGAFCVTDFVEVFPCANPAPEGGIGTIAEAPATAGTTCDVNRPIKVALVIAQLGDKSFLDSAARGMQFVNEQFKNVETKIIENNDVGEQQLAARAMADAKYDLVVTVGFGSADWTSQIAAEFPEVKFAIVDAELADADGKALPNGTGLTFREDQGSFTVGMIAGLLTKTGKVGFVGGMDFPLLRRFELGFIQGVKYVNPNVEVTSGWVGSFSDPNKGKELALTQIAEGADIVYAAAGKSGEGVLQAAKEQGKFSIGVDSDQDYLQPGSVVTSMLKRVDLAVLGAVQDLVNCDLKSGTKVFGLEEGSVGATFLYSDDTIFLQEGPDDMVKQLKETIIPAVKDATELIKNGDFCVTDFVEVFPCANPAPEGGYKP